MLDAWKFYSFTHLDLSLQEEERWCDVISEYQQCVFQCVLGFPPGQRRDGGVGVAARVAGFRVSRESWLLLLLLLAV